LGSNSAPDIAAHYTGVLSLDQSGSLVLWNVPLNYSGTYTVTVTKPGAHEASVSFTLMVYDSLSVISVDTRELDAVEGGPAFSLYYSSSPGQATSWKWFFNGLELADDPRYSITSTRLTINQPSRNDTGQYTVDLRNPFSSGTQSRNITVLYGPDQPFLEVSPTKVSFVSGETLNMTCGAVGEPTPSASWVFQGHTLPGSSSGTLKLTDVQPSQSGTYTCVLTNAKTSARLERNITIDVRGLSSSAIAGIAAGVPCGILLIILFICLVALCVFCYKKQDHNPRYPVSRAVEKAVISQPDLTKPHNLLTNGFKLPPDYNLHVHQMFPERSGPLPVPAASVRMATTV
ncbi:carcinoembryonic antigen-related cell adhesion molecule 6-like, partial [Hoplias malabaricus]|uniref:carcinoembryonic antigen-related cell adhesion molecule 6-like n=1 Tax=Hoplias malabaricus TaxID=27720 RepID=UPI003461FAE7